MANFHGKPLIHSILTSTEGLFTKRIVVTRHADIVSYCNDLEIPVLLHDLPLRSDTVRLGLETMEDMDACLFCPSDQPLLQKETLSALLAAATEEPDSIWRPMAENTPGAPVLFPSWAYPELLTLPEGKGGGYLIKKYPDKVSHLPITDPFELMDADTPETLEQLRLHTLERSPE